jgi:hypothetical protein
VWKVSHKNDKLLSTYGFARQNQYKVCDTCSKPDIYFLLYDEYGGSLSLKEQYNFNNDLDSFLRDRDFSVQAKSRSNYNFTAFSMSSILNMSFIEGIQNTKSVTADDYANCNLLIRDNEVIKFLDAHGYDIVNYSVFDLAGNPAMVEQSFLPLKTKLISDRTLFAHMNKDIGWLLITRWPFSLFSRNDYMKHKDNNKDFQQRVIDASKEKPKRPRFIYSHFYMPHPPYFFDRYGNMKDEAVIYNEFKTNPPASYLEYLIYVNSEIKKLVDTLKQNTPSAVIIIMSDHGYRARGGSNYPYFFQNLNAVYFPDKNYSALYDSMTSVNQFRVVLNKYFHQTFPLLKDSCVLLIDKK